MLVYTQICYSESERARYTLHLHFTILVNLGKVGSLLESTVMGMQSFSQRCDIYLLMKFNPKHLKNFVSTFMDNTSKTN